MVCQWLELIALLLKVTMVIMFFLVAINRLLETLSWGEEMRGRDIPSGVAIKLLT
jgi:hypothetical protein